MHLSGAVERDLSGTQGHLLELGGFKTGTNLFFQRAAPKVAYGLIGESNGVPAGIWPSKGGNREAGARERLEVLGTKGTAAPRCRRAFPGNTGHLRYGFEDPVPLRRPIGAG